MLQMRFRFSRLQPRQSLLSYEQSREGALAERRLSRALSDSRLFNIYNERLGSEIGHRFCTGTVWVMMFFPSMIAIHKIPLSFTATIVCRISKTGDYAKKDKKVRISRPAVILTFAVICCYMLFYPRNT